MPWFLKKRVWLTSLVLLLLFFVFVTQVPSPPRYNLRTAGLENPVFYRGQVDYFAEFERGYNEKLHPMADNGYRDMLIACGPRILDQDALMDTVLWAHLPADLHGSNYYYNYWLPLCEKLEMDPVPRPKYLDSLGFQSYFAKSMMGEQGARNYREKIAKTPFDLGESPEIETWLLERSPVLDLFNESVRKPNYFCPKFFMRDEDWGYLCAILLPDVTAQRTFAQDLQVRIGDRIFRGDLDGAWHDTMSMYLLSRKHYQYEPWGVVQLVGLRIEEMGHESLRLILTHGEPTRELLDKIAADLDSLPPLEYCFNELKMTQLQMHELLKQQQLWNRSATISSSGFVHSGSPSPDEALLAVLPLDQNIAGENLTQLFERSGMMELAEEKYCPPSSAERERFDEKFDKCMQFFDNHLNYPTDARLFMSMLTIQSRSRYAADVVFREMFPAISALLAAFDRTQENFESIREEVEQMKNEK